MCVIKRVCVCAHLFVHLPLESVLYGFMNGLQVFLPVHVSCLCVQTAMISFDIDHYNQLNFFF